VLAIDGKTLRRSFDRAAAVSPLAVVTAFACDARLVLGQVAIPPGGNEITAARTLLGLLDLTGMLVTGDAIHCRTETARLVQQRGGEWLFALKANRPLMLNEVADYFADPPAGCETYTTTDADHGRLETRRHVVGHTVAWLFSDRRYPDEPALPGLATLAMVEATTERERRTSTVRRYYISSATLSAVRFAAAVRAHWRIENSLHWVLDTTFDEDRARNRCDHGPPRCESWPSTWCAPPVPASPSAESASAPDGQMTSPVPSSAKCDSPDLGATFGCRLGLNS
jgi:predicted transposase YbfD/YdcC